MRFAILYLAITFTFSDSVAQESTQSLIKLSIYFGGGSYYIDEEQCQELIQFIENIENLDQYKIVLFSHTDNIGRSTMMCHTGGLEFQIL